MVKNKRIPVTLTLDKYVVEEMQKRRQRLGIPISRQLEIAYRRYREEGD